MKQTLAPSEACRYQGQTLPQVHPHDFASASIDCSTTCLSFVWARLMILCGLPRVSRSISCVLSDHCSRMSVEPSLKPAQSSWGVKLYSVYGFEIHMYSPHSFLGDLEGMRRARNSLIVSDSRLAERLFATRLWSSVFGFCSSSKAFLALPSSAIAVRVLGQSDHQAEGEKLST